MRLDTPTRHLIVSCLGVKTLRLIACDVRSQISQKSEHQELSPKSSDLSCLSYECVETDKIMREFPVTVQVGFVIYDSPLEPLGGDDMIFERKILFKMPQIRATVPGFSRKWGHLSGPELTVSTHCPKALKDQFHKDLLDLMDNEPLTPQRRDDSVQGRNQSVLRLVRSRDRKSAA